MSSPPGRRIAPQPQEPEGSETSAETTSSGRRVAGRRASEPTTGTIPVIKAPLLGDDETAGGRRIRPVAPVSLAGDTEDRTVVRSFDHTGEIPAIQFQLPPHEEARRAPATGSIPLPVAPQPAEAPAPAPEAAAAAETVLDPLVDSVPLTLADTADDVELTAGHSLSRALAEGAEVLEAAEAGTDGAAEPRRSARAGRASSSRRSRAERTPIEPSLLPEPGTTTPATRAKLIGWSGVLAVGVVLLALAALHIGPEWIDGVGAVAVLSTYCWAIAGRTGGRQVVFSALGGAIGITALLVDSPVLRSGAAMMTCVVSAVLAVCLTVPARNFLTAVREVVIAIAVASIGAFAVIGFEPVASTSRFEILALCIGMAAMVSLVWRFAAGIHGLGTRGLAIVIIGTVLLTASQLYTELWRAYGDSGVVRPTSDVSAWLRETFGASPRTTMVFLGVPALVWGVHMRARRRQGWWVCTFGAAATLPVAQRLVNLETSYIEAGLQTFYSVALGCLIGWVLIRLDLRLTGTRGARARADEETGAVRPEPARFSSL